jgi:hypothetical protein
MKLIPILCLAMVATAQAETHPRTEVKDAYTQWFNVAEKGNAPNWQLIKVDHVVKWFRNPSDDNWWSFQSDEFGPNNLTSPRASWCDSLHPGCNFFAGENSYSWTAYSYQQYFNVGESAAANWQPIQVNHFIKWDRVSSDSDWFKLEWNSYGDESGYGRTPKEAYVRSLGYLEKPERPILASHRPLPDNASLPDFSTRLNATSMAVFGHPFSEPAPGTGPAYHEENISDVIAKSVNYERDIEDAYQKGLDDGDAVPTANNGIVPLYPVTYSR